MTDPVVATFAGPKVTGVDQECATVEKLGVQELALVDNSVLMIGGFENAYLSNSWLNPRIHLLMVVDFRFSSFFLWLGCERPWEFSS